MMKSLRWQIIVAAVALIVIAVLLLGRGRSDNPFNAERASGGVYTEALIGSFGRLNPVLDFYNQPDQDIDRLLFSGLLRFDSLGNPIADLAEAWGIAVDGKSYNLSLKENLVFHDGAPLTSEDIIFTIDLLRNPDLPVPADLREFWISIEVQAFDERTLQFRLTEPFAPFLDYLTFGVLPKHILGELSAPELINAEFNLSPVGSGPYEFEQLLIEDENVSGIVLKAFEGYFQKRALIDQVIFRYYDSSTAALDAYRQDQVNGIGQVTPDILMDVLAEPALNIYSGRLPQLTMVVMNLNSPDLPFFQDVEVRRALLTGLNRQKMVRRILSGQAVLADSPLFPGTWAYYDGLERVEYSPNAALDQLRAAGYRIPAEGGNIRAKDSVLLAFDLVHPNTETHTAIARSIQQDWARLNVKVNLVAVEYTSLVSDYLEPRNFQAALIDINLAGYSDPDPYPFWHQAQATGGQNYAGWNDRRASEYLEQARVTIDHDQRIRLYRNFQVHFSREMPAILLYYPIYNYAISDQVGGVRMGPLFDPSDRFFNLVTWFLHARGQIEDIISPSELP